MPPRRGSFCIDSLNFLSSWHPFGIFHGTNPIKKIPTNLNYKKGFSLSLLMGLFPPRSDKGRLLLKTNGSFFRLLEIPFLIVKYIR